MSKLDDYSAEAFIDNPNNYPIINHIDNNPQNNNASNLEWCTQSENITHGWKCGNIREARRC